MGALPYSSIVTQGKESYVSCPFNNEHRMCESSLQKHILRCMVNYPNYISCPYNALHFFRTKQILENHLLNCPCRPFPLDLLQDTNYQEELMHAANLRNLRYWNMEYENWDKED